MVIFYLAFLLILDANNVMSLKTTLEVSQKLYSNLCFAPSPMKDFDLSWLNTKQPAEGFYAENGNDVMQVHKSSTIKGRQQNCTEDFSDMCFKVKIGAVGEVTLGEDIGYGNLSIKYPCKASKDMPGTFRCDLKSLNSDFEDASITYFAFQNKNLSVTIKCFKNTQVGWLTLSQLPHLSAEDKKTVYDKMLALGFPADTNVIMFNDKCKV